MKSIKEIESKLKKQIIGQDDYVKFLAHYAYKLELCMKECIDKSGVPIPLILGPSGCGKTYGIQKMCNIIGIHYHIVDGSSLTKTGYKGNNVLHSIDNILSNEFTPILIVFDEIDKANEEYDMDRDKGIIYSDFLKVLENKRYTYKDSDRSLYNVFFAFAGSFNRILMKKNNLQKKTSNIFGYESINDTKQTYKINKKDLFDYGINSEFLGRITNIVQVNNIQKGTALIMELLNKKDDSLFKSVDTFLESIGINDVEYTTALKKYICENCREDSTGIREIKHYINSQVFDKVLDYHSEGHFENTNKVILDAKDNTVIVEPLMKYQEHRK